ncbi:MAG TPA: DegT/DnrJ/EryC1/StrS family aminotransferase [Actinomycetota bacterium]|nr:DegT/DnrJ/EryC1/StrS family aminotransferase [Actinomycetota bacterium]
MEQLKIAGRAECPVADRLNERSLSLPCSVGLNEADQERVIEALRAPVGSRSA